MVLFQHLRRAKFQCCHGLNYDDPDLLFKQLGGYTEALPINFNDVDYCLKASALVIRRLRRKLNYSL